MTSRKVFQKVVAKKSLNMIFIKFIHFVPLFSNTAVVTLPDYKECGDFHGIKNVVFVDFKGKLWVILNS